jgi:hypothetical protein
MPFDCFISYATEDRIAANAACARLEAAAIRCWIAPRDITAGISYGEAIIEAIHEVKVMVLVFSSNANSSDHIPKEVERAVSNGLTIVPLRIEDVMPGKRLDYFIGSIHWLDAMTPPLDRHLDNLVGTVQKLLAPQDGSHTWQPPKPPPAPPPAVRAFTRKQALGIGTAAALLLTAVVLAAIHAWQKPVVNPPGPAPVPQPAPVPTPVPPGPTPPQPAPMAGVDPIVGCYHWFNNGMVMIRADGTMMGGPFPGHWRRVSASGRAYTFTWPTTLFSVTVSANQSSLSGMNQYQYPISATRSAGAAGLVGAWNLSNNVPMIVYPGGTLTVGNLKGTWKAVDATRGTYSLTWPGPVDSVTLSADGQQIHGQNQYGIDISGTRTGGCGAS